MNSKEMAKHVTFRHAERAADRPGGYEGARVRMQRRVQT